MHEDYDRNQVVYNMRQQENKLPKGQQDASLQINKMLYLLINWLDEPS